MELRILDPPMCCSNVQGKNLQTAKKSFKGHLGRAAACLAEPFDIVPWQLLCQLCAAS